MALVKKISTRTVFGTKADVQKLVLEDQKSNHFLYRVYGEARGFVTGTSKFSDKDEPSEWQALAGEFEAVNNDGEVFDAAVCFLPAYVIGPIVERLKQEGVENVTFGFDIYAQYDEKAATSYIYLCEPLRRAGEEAAIDKMREGLKPLPGKANPQIEHKKGGKKE